MTVRALIYRVRSALPRRLAGYRWFVGQNTVALTFEFVPRRGVGPPDEPPQRPRPDTVGTLFADIEDLYWLAVEQEHARQDPSDLRHDERWAVRVIEVHFGSPFRVFLEVPPEIWAGAAASLIGALATVFGAPYKAGATIHAARAEYWQKRLEADDAKRAWLESRRRAQAEEGFRLVDVELPGAKRDED